MATTTVNLENFMIEAHKTSGMHFNTFHAAFRTANDRRGRTLYQEIKNGEMTVIQLVNLLKMFGA
jgi:hypothetical protein